MSTELLAALRLASANPTEVESLLLSHFGHSQTQDNVVSFQRRSDDGFHGDDTLRLHFGTTKKSFGRIVDVEAGPAFDQADVPIIAEKVDTHLLATAEREVTRRVLFSYVPVPGAYRHSDRFQILPMPPESPRPRNQIMDHQPFVLEVAYNASRDRSVSLARAHRVVHETVLLLGLLLEPPVFASSVSTTYQWVVNDWSDDPRPIFARNGYPTPPPAFALALSPIDAYPALVMEDATSYYGSPGIEGSSVLKLPSVMNFALHTYDALAIGCSNRPKLRIHDCLQLGTTGAKTITQLSANCSAAAFS
jgi:hypothetical protein